MISPFDRKNRIAGALDRLALRLVLLLLCIGYFFFLWHSGISSLMAGSALFTLLVLSLMLFERRTLSTRDRVLRERVGGAIALDELLLLPNAAACERVCQLLCTALGASMLGGAQLCYGGKRYLVRCAQCLPGSNAGESDILGAHRARVEAQADHCVLASTGGFSPAAARAAEWMDPPVRMIAGRQLAQLAGRQHPATDEEIAHHARREKQPFSRARIRVLALSPSKLRRYLLCAFLLLLLYLLTGTLSALPFSLLSFVLAMLCSRENRRSFRL